VSVVYHGVPRGMVGETLYPLSGLAAVAPEAYELQRSKYAGREASFDVVVPGLGVGLHDVLHCAPIHPNRLFEARRAAGLDPPARPQRPALVTGLAYEIPLERILVNPTVWYSARTLWVGGAPGADIAQAPPADEFEPFDAERYRPLEAPPPAHLDWVRSLEPGKPSLMFVHIPHVLVAGPIDVSGLRMVPWDEPPVDSSRTAAAQPGRRARGAPTGTPPALGSSARDSGR
jgi:hypothetical protein